jgi:hypothetical protein
LTERPPSLRPVQKRGILEKKIYETFLNVEKTITTNFIVFSNFILE